MMCMLHFLWLRTQNNFVRPKINEKGIIDIKNGRHPVVEKMISNDMFIANDTYLDNGMNRISIITGPNMAGKSTYMRQTARLLCLWRRQALSFQLIQQIYVLLTVYLHESEHLMT